MHLRGRRAFRRQNDPPRIDPAAAVIALALLVSFVLFVIVTAR